MRRSGRCPGGGRPAQRSAEFQLDDRAALDRRGAGTVHRLYIEALQDRSVPIAVQRTMQRLVPGARIATIDTDHAPQLFRT